MLSFKTFLDPFAGLINENFDFKSKKDEHGVSTKHVAKVGKHKVGVVFSKYEHKGQEMTTDVDFHVNGNSLSDDTVRPHEGHAILHHVAKVINAYKAQNNPKGYTFTANTGQKSEMYQKFAKHLAKHYGGEYRQSPYHSQIHHVKFHEEVESC